MCSNMEPIDEDDEISRVSYIEKIIEKLQSDSYTVPKPSQERVFQEALRQLVNLHSNEEFDQPMRDNEEKILSMMHDSSCNVNSHSRGKTRRQMLREILTALKNLERGRLYSPPADNEIGYYQVMKNHIRLIITFDGTLEVKGQSDLFHHVTRFSILSYVMELEELRRQLQDISSHLIDMDIRNGFSLKPFMGMKPNFKASTSSWNKGNSNLAFYQHKFVLAYADLWSSDLAASPPKIEEKKLYDNVINYVGVPSSSEESSDKIENLPFHVEDLPYLFHNRVVGVMDNLMRNCMDIISTILAKLSISCTFDSLVGCYHNNCRKMVNEFVHHCKASDNDLLNYIEDFDRSIEIAKYIHRLIIACCTATSQLYDILDFSEGFAQREIEWELIHALTLSNFASIEFPDEYVETDCTMCSENGGSKNVVILQGILKYLEDIGILHANRMLDEEEAELLNKIEKKVASAVEFFYSAMAYRQRGMTQLSLSSDGIVEVGGKMNENKQTNHHLNFDSWDDYCEFFELLHNFNNLKCILEAIKKGLIEKPIRQEVKNNMLCSMNCSMQNEICRDTCLPRRLRLASEKHIDW